MIERPHPVAVLNIGGVANVTFIGGSGDPHACDTGPGNALIDDFMRERAGLAHDPAGENAAQGQVDEEAVRRVLAHPFFAQKLPKSLDRNDFRTWVAAEAGLANKSVPDGAATLTAITAASIAAIVPLLPKPPRTWIVAGGGAQNLHAAENAGAAARACERRDRECGRMEFGCGRGAGLRLHGGAALARIADHVSDHDRRGKADAGRGAGAAVIISPDPRTTRSMPFTTRANRSLSILSGVSVGL